MSGPLLITETRHGFVCANSGVDESSSGAPGRVVVLPADPDASARRLRDRFGELGVDVAVIISDTFGRPWREGQTDVAVGLAGINPITNYIGQRDPHGHEFRVQQLCVADELAGAAELVKGNLSRVPAAVIRGFPWVRDDTATAAVVDPPSRARPVPLTRAGLGAAGHYRADHATAEEFAGPTTELLQSLIRNECVNDGTPDSGNEIRNAELLAGYLEGAGIDVERFESRPGRASIVARIEGSDPSAPSLCLMGHTDVVPVNPDGWSRDPFGGEVIRADDGTAEVWGRGAIDMLNTTAAMAVAFRRLAAEGFRPRGTLIYFGVADEEAGGGWGAEHVLDHHWDAVGADYVLTELGGWSQIAADGRRRVTVNVAEKGLAWLRLRVAGTPGHGSMPYRTDNALVTAAEVVRRLAALPARAAPRRPVAGVHRRARRPRRRRRRCSPTRSRSTRRSPRSARRADASPTPARTRRSRRTSSTAGRRRTRSPTSSTSRSTSAPSPATRSTRPASTSPRPSASWPAGSTSRCCSTPSRRARRRTTSCGTSSSARLHVAYPGAELVPGLIVGGTDARFYRQRGSVAYGAALFSPGVTFESFGQRFHGNDERIDVDSLGLCGEFFYGVSKELLS